MASRDAKVMFQGGAIVRPAASSVKRASNEAFTLTVKCRGGLHFGKLRRRIALAMIKRLLRSLYGDAAPTIAPPAFSLSRLAQQVPGLADLFTWNTNPVPTAVPPWLLHLGCGEQVLDGFV